MEYLIVILTGAGFLAFVIGREICSEKKKRKNFRASLKSDYGKLPQKDYSLDRFARIDSFYKRHREEGQIDDITWNDLNMDQFFKRVNMTFCASGEEYLYYKLRTPVKTKEELSHFEELTEYFREHEEERIHIQELFHQLGYTGKYSLYDYIENLNLLEHASIRKHLVADLCYLVGIGLMFVDFSLGVLSIVVLMVCNILTYFKEKSVMEPFMVSFAYISRLLECTKRIRNMKLSDGMILKEEKEVFERGYRELGFVNQNAKFVFSGSIVGTSSNPMDILTDYLKMIFHLDIMLFYRMIRTVKGHFDEMDDLIAAVGAVESAIAVGNWRQYLEERGWCRPEFGMGGTMIFEKVYHPMLTDPVDNTIEIPQGKGVLITGSNASGKSTFLRTLALNFLTAQTIHTCTAKRFCTPLVRLFSSMSLRDDLLNGESYYMAEIRSIKRILDETGRDGNHLVCFVDEVLRGTNTVERIAASTEILDSLCSADCTCFAATHDIELTGLLEEKFENYHFEEQFVNGDVLFSYRLFDGKADSSNAILLLEIMGYQKEIIEHARERVKRFLAQGRWKMG